MHSLHNWKAEAVNSHWCPRLGHPGRWLNMMEAATVNI